MILQIIMQFEIDKTDLKKLSRFFKQAPREFQKASAGVINTLAFETRKLEIKEIAANMIIRNKKIIAEKKNPFFYVQTAKPTTLDRQIAIVGSVRRERFTGWEEQETGGSKKRISSLYSRGGSKRGIIKARYRIHPNQKFYKPNQYKSTTYKRSFGHMMRILNIEGSGRFILSEDISIKNGILGKGLYSLEDGKIKRLQSFNSKPVRQIRWRENAINKLRHSVNIQKIWADQITHYINKYR